MAPSRLSRALHAEIPLPPVRRWTIHLFFWAVIWPALTIFGTAYALMRLPYYAVSLGDALLAGVVGIAIRLPDMLLVGALAFGYSWWLFNRFGDDVRSDRYGALRLLLEPFAVFLGLIACVSLWYPAVLSQSLFAFVAWMPALGVLVLLAGAVFVALLLTGRAGSRVKLAATIAVLGAASPLPMWTRAELARFGGSHPDVLLLGVDSMSHADDLRPLADWVRSEEGIWHERAVTPGLFTNAVWASILTMSPVRDHGIFHTFQRLPAEDAVLLAAARRRGYRTVAVFPDQLTCAVGSRSGFDEDHSGPVGWRQLLMPAVANNSFFLPILTPVLPRPWRGSLPANEAATFTYDIRQEVRQILRAGTPGEKTLVAAHLTYAHLPAYPGTLDLTWQEARAVWMAPAGVLRDRTIDWGDTDWITDPVPLRRWKVRRLQGVIREEITASRFLADGGRLAIFSDHGSRAGMTRRNFGSPRYHHVVLATFGLRSACPQDPISLIDIGALVGLTDKRADPVVEFTFAEPSEWPALARSVRLQWPGDVDLDASLLSGVFADLRRDQPWPEFEAGATGTRNLCSAASP